MLKTEKGGYAPHPGFLASKCVVHFPSVAIGFTSCAARRSRGESFVVDECESCGALQSLIADLGRFSPSPSFSITSFSSSSPARFPLSGRDGSRSLRSQARFVGKPLSYLVSAAAPCTSILSLMLLLARRACSSAGSTIRRPARSSPTARPSEPLRNGRPHDPTAALQRRRSRPSRPRTTRPTCASRRRRARRTCRRS